MFLTAEEVADLTGYKKPGAQIKWLTAERYGFAVGGEVRLLQARQLLPR